MLHQKIIEDFFYCVFFNELKLLVSLSTLKLGLHSFQYVIYLYLPLK